MSDIAKMIAIAKRFGGGGSGGGEVVIVPETVLETIEGTFVGATPLSNVPTDGATAVITYNGVEYTSPIIYVAQNAMFVMGNTEALGIQGGNADAPFMVALSPSGYGGQHVSVMPLDDATSVTISIVQTAGGAAADSGGNGVMTVRVEASTPKKDMALSGCDKTFAEFQAAYNAGKLIRIIAATEDNGNPVEYVGNVVYYAVSGGIGMFAVAMPYATGTTTKQFLIMAGDEGEAIFTSYDNA